LTQNGGRKNEFERIASAGRTNVVTEFLGYLRESKKWWMLPILIVMLGLGVLVLLSSTPVAPFIYTLF
jgi:uncharacterized protein DUF5989